MLQTWRALVKGRTAYLFILPFFILFAIFQLFPLIWTFYISTTEWNGLKDPKFVGLDNYTRLFADSSFWDAFWNTSFYWIAHLIIIIPSAVFISVMLKALGSRRRKIFSTLTFLPYICATVAIGLVFNIIFDTNLGLANDFLGLFGIPPVEWMTSVTTSKIPVVFLHSWRIIPWFTIIVFASIISIPQELYEAARVDGATVIRQFWHITLPGIRTVLIFCFIMVTVESWQMFTEPYILKGPATSNISLFQYMYTTSFEVFKMGYGAAIGVVLTLIMVVISTLQFVLSRKRGEN